MLSTLFVIFCVCLTPIQGLTCTTFILDNNGSPVIGKNYDLYAGPVELVMVNKRGVTKTAWPFPIETNPPLAAWTSKYGSITFNPFAREMPLEGMNEAGLLIEGLQVVGGAFPEPDSRSVMSSTQWIQYQLDTSSTLEEVIASDKDVRIYQSSNKALSVHFLVCDSQGNSAIIEWLNGKMVVYTGETMSVKVLTNQTYDLSLKMLHGFRGFGGLLPTGLAGILIKCMPNSFNNSPARFIYAADMVRKFDLKAAKPSVDYAFKILSRVSQPKFHNSPTECSMVFDVPNRTVHFRTIHNNKIRSFNLSSFDFSCTTPVKVLDAHADLSGEISGSFVDYTDEMNRELIKSSTPNVTDTFLDDFEKYIESQVCTE